MASQACFQVTVTDEFGNIKPGATVTINQEAGGSPLATLYSDRAGASPISNPMTADSSGFVQFFVAGGVYKITATQGGFTRTWRYVPISRAAEMLPATDGYIPFANDNGLTTDSALFWDNTNKRLGIGVGTSPSANLDVKADASSAVAGQFRGRTSDSQAYFRFLDTTGSTVYALFGSPAANTLAFYTNGFNERMRIDSSGNVGIGTSTILAAAKLQVNGIIYQVTPFGAFGQLETTTGFGARWTLANDSTYRLQLTADGFTGITATPILFDSSGNVGIGASPGAYNVKVQADKVGRVYYAIFNVNSTTKSAALNMSSNSAAGAWEFGTDKDVNNGDNLYIYGGGSGAMRWVMDASGNMGVANASPVNKLDVTGSIGFGAPVTKTGDFSLAATENSIICNKASTLTVTLPAASSWTGRRVRIQTITANTVVSASSNVVPRAGGAAGTAILAATAGAWAELESDGTNWKIMSGS